uniref:Uncharacterized protein n=1 Tax=Romanomermis culicivorax TaxID=13658 RepID=A0A915IYS7_ROMCU
IHNAHQYLKHKDFLKDKQCIIQIHNDDNLGHLCFMQPVGKEQIEEDMLQANKKDKKRYTLKMYETNEIYVNFAKIAKSRKNEKAAFFRHSEKCQIKEGNCTKNMNVQ